jgi:hypothetical protein
VANKTEGNLRPTGEDILRAVAYLSLTAWGILFLMFPPVAYLDTTDLYTRIAWMGVGIVGSLMAASGALTRIDIKLELPGVLLTLIAPLFYSAAQVYFLLTPTPGVDPTSRIALSVYAITPFLLMLPRAFGLYSESQRLKRINRASSRAWSLTNPNEPEPDRQYSIRASIRRKGSK